MSSLDKLTFVSVLKLKWREKIPFYTHSWATYLLSETEKEKEEERGLKNEKESCWA